jgi:hypothetical protein
MAITIRNKQIEAGIRELGRRRNEGPSAVIARLVKAELTTSGCCGESEHDRVERRRRAMAKWLASLPPITDEGRREIDRMMEEMYDDDGLPR